MAEIEFSDTFDVAIPNKILNLGREKVLHGTEVLLYMVVANLSNNDRGYCYASDQTLAECTGYSDRQVRNALRVLSEHELIYIDRNQFGHGRHIYIFKNGKVVSGNVFPSTRKCISEDNNSEDTGVSSSLTESKKGGGRPPQKPFQKVPNQGLVNLKGKVSPPKTKKPPPKPSKEAMAVAMELREAIRSVTRWIPAASSNKRWALELTKLARRKSPTDLSKGWQTIRNTIRLVHYANHPDYDKPDFNDAFVFCRLFTWITQKLQEIRHMEM